jgi:hypothetical protein
MMSNPMFEQYTNYKVDHDPEGIAHFAAAIMAGVGSITNGTQVDGSGPVPQQHSGRGASNAVESPVLA